MYQKYQSGSVSRPYSLLYLECLETLYTVRLHAIGYDGLVHLPLVLLILNNKPNTP
nr:hypothetical protein [uncultured bacterium]